MPVVRLPAALRRYAGGAGRIAVGGSTVAEALAEVAASHPDLGDRLLTSQGALRAHLQLGVAGRVVPYRDAAATPLADDDEVVVVVAIAGGAASVGRRGDRCAAGERGRLAVSSVEQARRPPQADRVDHRQFGRGPQVGRGEDGFPDVSSGNEPGPVDTGEQA